MPGTPPGPTRFSLRRWSQRKLEAARNADAGPAPQEAPASVATAAGDAPREAGAAEAASSARPDGAAPGVAAPATAAPAARMGAGAPALPPIESLSIDSDFSPFMQPGVDEDVKRSALRKLLRDPRFNVMDGLDVYIDDYSKPDPIDPAVVRTLMQARYIFDPPKTRVNAEGHVEDVPLEEPPAAAAGAAAQTAGTDDPALASAPLGAALPRADAAPRAVPTQHGAAADSAPLPDSKAP